MDNAYKIKPLHIMLRKTSAYVKSYYGEIKWMWFLNEDDILLFTTSLRLIALTLLSKMYIYFTKEVAAVVTTHSLRIQNSKAETLSKNFFVHSF